MFKKHVKLIMEQDGLTNGEARLQAWAEGEAGYHKRTAAA